VGIAVLAVAFVQFGPVTGSATGTPGTSGSPAIGLASSGAGTDSTGSAEIATFATATTTASPAPTVAGAATAGPTATAGPSATLRAGGTTRATPRPTAGPTAALTASPKATATSSAPCPIFPASNVWNRDISNLPVAANSSTMIDAIGLTRYLHPDFDAVGDGIPYNIVNSSTPTSQVSFEYADESDPVPYPIPASPKIEKGSDAHMLMLDTSACRLWELTP
jgi:hypothetical protein